MLTETCRGNAASLTYSLHCLRYIKQFVAKPKASQISPRTGPGIAARTARDQLVVEDAGELAKHCAATVPDFHDVEEPDSKPTRPQCRGLRHFPKPLEAGTHHESRSWLLDLPLGWRVLRVATIVLMGPVQKRLVAPTGFVTDFQHRSSPLGGGLRTTGFHECEGTAGLGKEYNSESPQMQLPEHP